MPEHSQRANERRFRRLVETLDHAVVWEFDDTDNLYTFVSQHSKLVLGYEAEAWLADPRFFEARVHPDDHARVLEAFDKLRRGEASDVRIEHRCSRADGAMIWVHSGAHCETENGHKLFRGVTIDIDHLKQAEERERSARTAAEYMAHARDEILAVVAHDLRNPLNTVQLACDNMDQTQQLGRNVQLVRRAISQMQRLIDDLLDAANIRAARLHILSGSFDAAQLVQHTADDFASLATERGISLRVENAESTVLQGDERRIAQALANLMNNALKFTEPGGTISLRLDVDPLHATFRVTDTGVGIHTADIDKVFDRTWQSDATAHLGSGMGLYIAKGIVEAHGGEISVTSVPGQGSVFSFFLPRS